MARKCKRFKRTSSGRRCADYSGYSGHKKSHKRKSKRSLRGYAGTKGMTCKGYKTVSTKRGPAKRCASYK